jgi:Methyltransferase FkbM domain
MPLPIRTLAAVVGVVAIAGAAATLRPRRDPPSRPGGVSAIRDMLWQSLQPVTLDGCRLERYGEANDGGYLLCGNLLTDVTAGYSYGISGYDGWGCQVSTALRVPVHQYDCFDTRAPGCAGGETEFHAECIGRESTTIDNRPYDTLEHQLARNGHGAERIVMKIDVEGAEWDVFATAPDDVLERIDQLVVEFHRTDERRFLTVVQRLARYFHVANLHMNNHACSAGDQPFGAWAYEVLFVNRRLPVTAGARRTPPFAPLDQPNDGTRPDCQVAPSAAR